VIRPLRSRHRASFVALALLLPPALVAALASREPQAASHLPNAWSAASEPSIEWLGAVELAGTGLSARQGRSADGRSWVELSGRVEPKRPDVLVYLAPQEPAEGSLPNGSHLVGSLGAVAPAPRVLELPAGTQGWLVLYSLGDAAVLGALELGG
jgi:hypothetical protein